MFRTLLLLIAVLLAAVDLRGQVLAWQPTPMMGSRDRCMMAYDPARDRVVVFGGTFCNGADSRNDTWEWNGQRWRECKPRVRAEGRWAGGMAYDYARGSVVLLGGYGYRTVMTPMQNDLWSWDGQEWSLVPASNMPPGRYNFGLASDPLRQKVVLFGGTRGFYISDVRNDTWEWDGQQWTQMHPATVPAPRLQVSMAWCGANSRILMYGGNWGLGFSLDPAWEWDGTNWTQLQDTAPGLRDRSLSCELPWNGHVLLHGGITMTPSTGYMSTDTWEWDGTSWTQIQTIDHPGSREWPSMAPHAGTREVIYYGGRFTGNQGYSRLPSADPGDHQDSVWAFRNQDWQRVPGNEVPQESFEFALPDSAHDQVVLLATTYALPSGLGTWATWVLRGEKLVELPCATPSWRWYPARGYHAGLGMAVLYGGMYNGFPLTDTWVFDGTQWTQDTTTVLPPDRRPSITYDSDRQVLVMVQQGSNDVYEWRGHGWTLRPELQLPFPLSWGRGLGVFYDEARHRLLLLFGDQTTPLATWEFSGGHWRLACNGGPFQGAAGSEMVYVPELEAVLALNSRYPDQLWSWDGANWTRFAAAEPLWDGLRVTTYVGFIWPVYDAARGIVRTFQPYVCGSLGNSQSGSLVWNLAFRTLDVDTRLPRLGQPVHFTIATPGPSALAVILFSDSIWPGIPVPGLGDRRLPLRPGSILQASAGALMTVLDGRGHGQATITVPNNPSLVGLTLRSAAVVLGQGGVRHVTNEVRLDVQR